MNHIEKLRQERHLCSRRPRNLVQAPSERHIYRAFIGSGMFVRRFMENRLSLRACIGTNPLEMLDKKANPSSQSAHNLAINDFAFFMRSLRSLRLSRLEKKGAVSGDCAKQKAEPNNGYRVAAKPVQFNPGKAWNRVRGFHRVWLVLRTAVFLGQSIVLSLNLKVMRAMREKLRRSLINTPLQRGVCIDLRPANRFNGFSPSCCRTTRIYAQAEINRRYCTIQFRLLPDLI
jgi:hypothetical protein